jgi:hypothetical protein
VQVRCVLVIVRAWQPNQAWLFLMILIHVLEALASSGCKARATAGSSVSMLAGGVLAGNCFHSAAAAPYVGRTRTHTVLGSHMWCDLKLCPGHWVRPEGASLAQPVQGAGRGVPLAAVLALNAQPYAIGHPQHGVDTGTLDRAKIGAAAWHAQRKAQGMCAAARHQLR